MHFRKYNIGETVIIGLTREIDGKEKEISISTELIEHIEYVNELWLDFWQRQLMKDSTSLLK